MAEMNAIVSTSFQPQISREQFDALLASHKAFHEVAIKVTDILSDPSRSAHYQSLSCETNSDADVNHNCRPNVWRSDSSVSGQSSGGLRNALTAIFSDRNACVAARVESSAEPTFQMENSRARKAYRQKKLRSYNMYSRASGSHLGAEYDFQYKFFPNDIYQQLERRPEAIGFDPWEWAFQPPSHSDIDAYNAYNQIDHGKRLQEMILFRKSELMEALFPLRTSSILQCMSWPELEYSYGLHLNGIVNRLGFGKCDNAIGFMDSDITSLIIEIGRFFTELDYSNRPKSFCDGNIPGAAGPFANGPWPEDVRKKFTMNELHRRCYQKDLIKDWEGNHIIRIVLDSVAGTGTSEHQAQMLYILEAVFAINRARRRNWPLRQPISSKESQMFILDFLGLFDIPDSQDDYEQSNAQAFAATDLNLHTLMKFGSLRVVWSDCIDDHLRLSASARTLTLFWDVCLLDQSLLFWYNAQTLRKFAEDQDLHHPVTSKDLKSHMLHELKKTYRLLFHNMDAKQLTTIETCTVKGSNPKTGIMIHDLRVDINSSRARKILKHLLNAPLPGTLSRVNQSNAKPHQLRRVWWPLGRVIRALHSLTRKKAQPSTIADHLASGPPYSLDLCWHLENILTPYPALAGETESMRSFSQFPRFGPRLREIKFYMDNQKPSGWYQLWKDKRDRVQHVTFWAVLVFGTISIVLALISIAVSSAQTVAAFRSVQGGS